MVVMSTWIIVKQSLIVNRFLRNRTFFFSFLFNIVFFSSMGLNFVMVF